MPAPLWTHDQRLVRYAPLGPRVDSGTRLYFYDLNGPRNVNGKIPGAPHGMMWSATGPMAMHNGNYVDGTTRWLEGYERTRDSIGCNARLVRVDLRSFAVPCRVLVWGGRKDHGGTGARWLVLARGLAYDTPPTRRREPAEMALTLAKRDHDWLKDLQRRLASRSAARVPEPYSDAHWRAIREYRYVMPAVQTKTNSEWAAEYLGHPTEPCPACAEIDGWGCREHQIKI